MWFKIEKQVFKIEAFLITLSLAIMLLAVLVQIGARMMGISSLGTSEIGMFTMSVLAFIGTSAITYAKDHITIELEQLIKSSKVVHMMKVITTLLIIVFAAIFSVVVFSFFQFTLEAGEKTIELGIPITIPIGFMLSGLILLIYHSICDLIRLFTKKNDVKEES